MAKATVCAVEGCGKAPRARGYCNAHVLKLRRYGDPLGGMQKVPTGGPCLAEGCQKLATCLGYCPAHYQKVRKYGDHRASHPRTRCNERWIEDHKEYAGDDCIPWPFSRGDNGRGVVYGKSAPRAMCIAAHGAPPTPSHEAAHSCGNGHLGCMNQRHLRWATRLDNAADRDAHGRTRRGGKINTVKLTERNVLEIRSRLLTETGASLAREFGVTPGTICSIKKRKIWAWLE